MGALKDTHDYTYLCDWYKLQEECIYFYKICLSSYRVTNNAISRLPVSIENRSYTHTRKSISVYKHYLICVPLSNTEVSIAIVMSINVCTLGCDNNVIDISENF